jgi:rhomboid protease GluP
MVMEPQSRHEGVIVRRCADRSQAKVYELVLSAKAIDSIIVHDSNAFDLLVSAEDANQALAELTAYDLENQESATERKQVTQAPPSIELVLIYWATLLFFFAANRQGFLSIPWLEIGSAEAGSIRTGEWWRVVTALFLHISGFHLLSNLAFGTVLLLLLSQVLGPGLTLLAVVVAGAGGNLLTALVRPPFYTSIGASTAIFAAIGVLAALRQNWQRHRIPSSLRDWAPLAGGIMLLALLGFSGEQTDILAHVFGFLAGACIGALLGWLERPSLKDWAVQLNSGLAAGAIVVFAWAWAILAGTVSS